MKFIIALLFSSIFFFNTSLASDNYKTGDTLYVWANSGLNLRKGPGTNFKTIDKISFGERVVVLQN